MIAMFNITAIGSKITNFLCLVLCLNRRMLKNAPNQPIANANSSNVCSLIRHFPREDFHLSRPYIKNTVRFQAVNTQNVIINLLHSL